MEYRVGVEIRRRGEGYEVVRRFPLPKNRAEELRLPHEVVYDLVFNDDLDLLIVRRAKHKNPYPGYYSTIAGHVEAREAESGFTLESPLQAALRELWEEARLRAELRRAFIDEDRVADVFDDLTGHVGYVFLCKTKGEPKFNEEIEERESGFYSFRELERKLVEGPFPPPERTILRRVLRERELVVRKLLGT